MPSASAAAPPGPPVRSVTRTWAPAAAALNAAADPAAPNPTTITSAVSSQRVISPASHGVTSFAYRLVPHLTTWRLTGPDGAVRFAKVARGGDRYPTLRGESERMIWAAPYLPVPVVVALAGVGDATGLLTETLPGHDATSAVWRDDLPGLVRALGRGLRRFHEAV